MAPRYRKLVEKEAGRVGGCGIHEKGSGTGRAQRECVARNCKQHKNSVCVSVGPERWRALSSARPTGDSSTPTSGRLSSSQPPYTFLFHTIFNNTAFDTQKRGNLSCNYKQGRIQGVSSASLNLVGPLKSKQTM